jgi:signal transduction histidine kinase
LEQRVSERTALLQRKTEELEEANERLKEADRAKSAFLAAMSHELRTPLNSIIGFSSILHDEWVGPVNAEQKENLASILRSGRRLLNMISDVLDVTQIEAGAITPDIEEFELHDLIAEAENEVTAAIREKGLELRSEPLRQRMRTDRRRLLQCVSNLLSNAAKFTDRGSVTMSARIVSIQGETPEAEMVEIAVTDTGIGIGEEERERIFEPFSRIITPQREIVTGTGLGLFLSRKIATEILKGDIIVCSEYGKGSRFSLRIPVRLP